MTDWGFFWNSIADCMRTTGEVFFKGPSKKHTRAIMAKDLFSCFWGLANMSLHNLTRENRESIHSYCTFQPLFFHLEMQTVMHSVSTCGP